MYDLFICHASEDKETVVESIVAECERRLVTCWYDKTNLKWGDDFVGAIAKGVQSSRFVLVIASENAVGKGWPLREISQAIEREIQKRETIVLPLFVGDRERLLGNFPQLRGKLGRTWENNPTDVVEEIMNLLGRFECTRTPAAINKDRSKTIPASSQPLPHLPRLPKVYSDQERNRFIRDSFHNVTEFFESAAKQYSIQEPRVTFDTDRLDSQKFALILYLDGKQKSQCQIWIDNSFARFQKINYFEGHSFNDYNASNEIISISESTDGLKLKGSMGGHFGEPIEDCSPTEVAERLWKRFVSNLA